MASNRAARLTCIVLHVDPIHPQADRSDVIQPPLAPHPYWSCHWSCHWSFRPVTVLAEDGASSPNSPRSARSKPPSAGPCSYRSGNSALTAGVRRANNGKMRRDLRHPRKSVTSSSRTCWTNVWTCPRTRSSKLAQATLDVIGLSVVCFSLAAVSFRKGLQAPGLLTRKDTDRLLAFPHQSRLPRHCGIASSRAFSDHEASRAAQCHNRFSSGDQTSPVLLSTQKQRPSFLDKSRQPLAEIWGGGLSDDGLSFTFQLYFQAGTQSVAR